MENKDLHYYINHFGDFSPVQLNIDNVDIPNHDFVFISSKIDNTNITDNTNNDKILEKNV